MPNPDSFLLHLCEFGYHSRSDKHSNALAKAIVDDLVAYCPAIAGKAASGELVYQVNFTLRSGNADWNVDLVVGPPALGTPTRPAPGEMRRANPATVHIAVEIKSVMTEHRKAVKNRKRDLEAHHEHVHHYNANTIAGGVLVINASETFQSPLRTVVSIHRDPPALVQHCIAELRSVATRGGTTGYGLEAKCGLVVNMDNLDCTATKYATSFIPVGDPLHYDAFIRTICDQFARRFS